MTDYDAQARLLDAEARLIQAKIRQVDCLAKTPGVCIREIRAAAGLAPTRNPAIDNLYINLPFTE